MLPVGQPSKVCTSARFCQIGVNGISEATVHDIGAGVGVLTPEKVGVGPNVPMGRVGWLRMTTVGRGSVGAGVDDGSLMPVGLGTVGALTRVTKDGAVSLQKFPM